MTSSGRIRRRVLMLIPNPGYGGAQGSFRRLGQVLAKHHEVQLVYFTRMTGAGYEAVNEVAGIESIYLDDGIKANKLGRWIARWHRLRGRKAEAEVAISFLPGANLLNVLTRMGQPTVISERGSRRYDEDGSPLMRWIWLNVLDKLTYFGADAIVSTSLGLSTELAVSVGRRSVSKIHTFEGYVDTAKLFALRDAPVERELLFLKNYRTVLACGRLHPQKGLSFLIRMFSRLKTMDQSVKLLIIGDGPQRTELVEVSIAAGLRVSDQHCSDHQADVFMIGYRSDPVKYFPLAKLFAFTSLYEGFPNILVEALASGVPIIAADCPWGPRSILSARPGTEVKKPVADAPRLMEFGLLMPPVTRSESEETWAREIASVLANEQAVPTGGKTRVDAVLRFDITKTGEAWLDLIDAVSTARNSAHKSSDHSNVTAPGSSTSG